MLANLLQDVRYSLHGFALGAEPARVRRMVLQQVGWMVAVGVPVGIGAALFVSDLARSLLFGLAPTDPFAAAGAAVVLGASYWPARRAAPRKSTSSLHCAAIEPQEPNVIRSRKKR